MNSLIVDNENVNVTLDGENFSPILNLWGMELMLLEQL